MLILTVAATMTEILCTVDYRPTAWIERAAFAFAEIGKRSYSIYIWHQVIIAFLFYSVFAEQNILSFTVFAVLTVFVSLVSYWCIEMPLTKAEVRKRTESFVTASSASVAFAVCVISLLLYMNAGVVRDVPELGIRKKDAHRGMHSEYCDRVYAWNRAFDEDSEVKILVIGNSFGRDWANILYEYSPGFDISFLYYSDTALLENLDRADQADFVFYAQGFSFGEVPDAVRDNIPPEKLFVVSNKNYGKSNGIIYAHRMNEEYYLQTVHCPEALEEDISHNKKIWGEHFIDMMGPVKVNDGSVRLFTDDNKLISQDCRHLTEAGAQYYARILDLENLFGE